MHEPGPSVGTPSSPRVLGVSLGNAQVFSVAGGPRAPADAREQLRERLGSKLDPEVVELAQLLLSELVSNCVLHGSATTSADWIDVTASTFPHAVWVEVSDGGLPFEHEAREPSLDAPTGRGLYLVEQIASRWGISKHPTSVWFELPRAG
jgi:anti-sigma regulatory factor (Ser/Thr protein kinase)